MSEFLGNYVDHQMTSPFAMAQHSAKIKPIANDLARRGVLLVASCCRVEVYGQEHALRNIDSRIFSGFPAERIEGAPTIIQRLAEIASGARSQVLGDNFIADQLGKAIGLLDPNLPIFQMVRLAIDIGRASRERHRFIASLNYYHIVRDIIADRFPNGELPDRLYVIGADMPIRELIRSGVGERFRSTTIVTRNPKNLRKRLRAWPDIDVAFTRPAEIGHAREPRSIVVIAWADVNDEYQAILQRALLRLEPRTIIDMTSNPLLSKEEFVNSDYVTVHDKEFLLAFEENNKEISPKLPVLLSDINETLRAAQTYLSANGP
ncbi:MAG: hypothetical protein EOR68_34130 [Mesorhizobium sp.]|uniref:hypothetical protein n=1 Tax=Mesorhizobium sp. TaxID=1871066 RepID=UPI000FE9485D|nr:hypothetical protein [Mesorhizobium sp.]RWL84870.1 MAG: hypothetical protein EOR68_34130 [Mesorhizobium sp.]TIP47827.1 MAG: hypothetical protein E5X77_14490 [Mesorhizobium sp.]TJV67774.1 MAG: hypothetical protein E5X76_32595 [Mesorhizobium sp.]